MEINAALRRHQVDRSEVLVRVWGIDTKGRAVNSLLTFGTLRAARCAAVRVLFELGSGVHFLIHQ
jgi:hypothetical protein